jgi:sugar (pentulose or hexulose) kinase
MRQTILLGLDVGGSSIKAGLVDTGAWADDHPAALGAHADAVDTRGGTAGLRAD